MYRRPLPTTNLGFLSTVMWDGRETFQDPASTDCLFGTTTCFAPLPFDLADQAKREGIKDLRQSALIKVKKGLTSLDEVEAVTNE